LSLKAVAGSRLKRTNKGRFDEQIFHFANIVRPCEESAIGTFSFAAEPKCHASAVGSLISTWWWFGVTHMFYWFGLTHTLVYAAEIPQGWGYAGCLTLGTDDSAADPSFATRNAV
jgi:hypothetical protein